jgi:hypothetical protein
MNLVHIRTQKPAQQVKNVAEPSLCGMIDPQMTPSLQAETPDLRCVAGLQGSAPI